MLSAAPAVRRTAPVSGNSAQLRSSGIDAHTLRVCGFSAGISSGCPQDRFQHPTHRFHKIQAVQGVDALTSMDAPVNAAVQQSFDEADHAQWCPGEVFEVSSVQQVTDLVLQHSTQKVILMCKSRACRPCKAFTLTFKRFATKYEDVVFLSVVGEQSAELRDMMIALNIRQTPTFLCFYQNALIHRHKGNNKERMEDLLTSDWQALKDALPERDPGDSFLGLS